MIRVPRAGPVERCVGMSGRPIGTRCAMQITGTRSVAVRGAPILAMLAAIGLLPTVASQAAAEAAATPQAPACDAARFKVALDVGHTEEVQGATSARGVKEYVFNLRLATQMEQALKE